MTTELVVRDVMTPDAVAITPGTSLTYARRLMKRHEIRHLPVMAAETVVGIVSSRDVLVTDRQLRRGLTALDSELIHGRYRSVDTVMSAPVLTVRADTPVAVAAAVLARERIGALPVLDGDRLVGIITTTDCLLAMNRAAAQPQAIALDEDDYAVAMPDGDDRPGRPAPRPPALVVSPSAEQRVTLRDELTADGFSVDTCPGPLGGTLCPGLQGPRVPRCPRVPDGVTVIAMDRATYRTTLSDTYRAWCPTPAPRERDGQRDRRQPPRGGTPAAS